MDDKNWGTQFDRYLIDLSKRKVEVEVTLTNLANEEFFTAHIGTVDSKFLRFKTPETNNKWVNRKHILFIEPQENYE